MKTIILLILSSYAIIASPIPDFPFIFVEGNATELIPTKVAKIKFTVVRESQNSIDGEKAIQAANKSLWQLLDKHGIGRSIVDASDISKNRISHDPFDQGKKDVYYRFTQVFNVSLKNLAQYPKLAEALVASELVSEFSSSFHGIEDAELTKRLRLASVKDAKTKASLLAEASESKLGAVHSISELPYSELSELLGVSGYTSLIAGGGLLPEKDGQTTYVVPKTVRKAFQVRIIYRLNMGQ